MSEELNFVHAAVFSPSVELLMDMYGNNLSQHFEAILASAGVTRKPDDMDLAIWPQRMGVFSRAVIETHDTREELEERWPKILAEDNADKVYGFPYFIFEGETLFLIELLNDGTTRSEEFARIGGGLYLSLTGNDYTGDGVNVVTNAVVIID